MSRGRKLILSLFKVNWEVQRLQTTHLIIISLENRSSRIVAAQEEQMVIRLLPDVNISQLQLLEHTKRGRSSSSTHMNNKCNFP